MVKYISEDEAEKLFDDYLDETHETIKILGMSYSPAAVLFICDSIAYYCCLAEWLDREGLSTETENNGKE